MSEYIECDTQMEDWDVLEEALADLGIDKIERHQNPVKLNGWNTTVSANVVIRSAIAHSRRDIGFEKREGKIRALIYDMDGSDIVTRIKKGELRQCYAKRMTIRTIQKAFRRSKIQECEKCPDGRIRIKIRMNT